MMRCLPLLLFVASVGAIQPPAPAVAQPSAPAGIDPERVGYPQSIAALGDSITRAFLSDNTLDAPQNSWSTGTDATVNSHYRRILAAEPAVSGHSSNLAVSGSTISALPGQASQAVADNRQYITILIGGNDVCSGTEAEMTPVATYRSQFTQALTTLSGGLPDARIFVASLPNIYGVWEVAHTNQLAQAIWSAYDVCPAMFVNPTSLAQADVERRARVRQRILDFNTQLAEVCALFIHCRFDGGAVTNGVIQPADLAADYFHPSLSGQGRLAAATYQQTFGFTDTLAPVSTATVTPAGALFSVALSASDDLGLAGIEYRLGAGAWQRYAAPLSVAGDLPLIYRAVDRNGNIEASRAAVLPMLLKSVYLPLLEK
jgi:lysophospholipase L1-like esterase